MPRLVAFVVALILVANQSALAQDPDTSYAERGPRFLLASASTSTSTAPVRVDVARTPVLRQRISLELQGVPLSEALREVSRQAGVHLAFSNTVLPPDRRVELRAESITVAAALTELLLDAQVDILFTSDGRGVLVRRQERVAQMGTVVGRVTDAKSGTALPGATIVIERTSLSATTDNDGRYRIAQVPAGTYALRARYIGYAPAATSVTVSADQEATADFTLEKSAQRLDEVVTTGTVVPTEVKALPTPISVVTAEDIQQQNLQRVDQVFRGQVPGAIAWDEGSLNWYSRISARGASALTDVSSIKTFIDGVEVSDPTLIAMTDPNSIDRIEVTRGPQASTLYGAGAMNGVMQIFTKKGQLGLTRPEVATKLSAGGVGSVEGQSTALQTDNSVSVFGGGDKTTYNLGGSYRRLGAWVPSYYSTDWGMFVGGQTTQGPLTLSSSARYADKTFDYPFDTRFQSYTSLSRPSYLTFGLRQQTYGVTASARATRNWQHTLTLGYDQSYDDLDQTRARLRTPSDSFLFAEGIHDAQTSLLYHTDLSVHLGNRVAATVTAGVNHVAYDHVFSFTSGATRLTGSLDGSTFLSHTRSTNTGYFSQLQVSLADRFFLTGGLRAERNPDFGTDFGTAWSPRVGAAYVLGLGPATVKLRASYGESIRAPTPGERDEAETPGYHRLANPELAPERQRGSDGGLEIYLGRASFGLTYYNQRAIDLIEQLLLTSSDTVPTYQNQNVSRVKNVGWEFEAHLPVGPVQLAGTYSITHSTVAQLPAGYSGDFLVGDQILGVPRSSAGATVTYSPLSQTTLTASMTYIGHWIQTDWVAENGFFYGDQPYRGSERAYWIEYPAVTKFAVGVSQELRQGLTAFLRVENVGNNLRFEQDNNQLPMPRSVLVGANLRY